MSDTLSRTGIYLPKDFFSHGQLYVTISRVEDKKNLKILTNNHQAKRNTFTDNVVFREILILIMNLDYDHDDRQSQHTAVIGLLHHQWSVLVCNATNNNDLHLPPLQAHVLARQSMHSMGTLLVCTKHAKSTDPCHREGTHGIFLFLVVPTLLIFITILVRILAFHVHQWLYVVLCRVQQLLIQETQTNNIRQAQQITVCTWRA